MAECKPTSKSCPPFRRIISPIFIAENRTENNHYGGSKYCNDYENWDENNPLIKENEKTLHTELGCKINNCNNKITLFKKITHTIDSHFLAKKNFLTLK